MSSQCGCYTDPCICGDNSAALCPPPAPTTKCDRYVPGTDNVWVEKGPNPGDELCVGICMLDTLPESAVINSIERNERARQDLLKVTSDPVLLALARTVPPLPKMEEADLEQLNQNRPGEPASNPFYAIFRGQPPFAQ